MDIKYTIKIPFMDGWIYLTTDTSTEFFDTYEEAVECCKHLTSHAKIVQVTFEEIE